MATAVKMWQMHPIKQEWCQYLFHVNQGLRSANHNPLTHNYAIEDALKSAHLKDAIDFVKLPNTLMDRIAKVIPMLI